MFVRWRDGSTRRNIECTEGGVSYNDSYYLQRLEDQVDEGQSESSERRALPDISKTEFVALSVANYVVIHARLDRDWEHLKKGADVAVELAPKNAFCLLARAQLGTLEDRDAVVGDVRLAGSVRRLTAQEELVAARSLLRVRANVEALEHIERGLMSRPMDIGLRAARVRVKLRLGRIEEARSDVRVVLTVDPDGLVARLSAAEVAYATNDVGWRSRLARLSDESGFPIVGVDMVDDLLAGIGGMPPDPRCALEVIDAIDGGVVKTGPTATQGRDSASGMSWTVDAFPHRRIDELRARAVAMLNANDVRMELPAEAR
jgi:hypothetical protein